MTGLIACATGILARHRFARFLLVGGLNTLVGTALFWFALTIFPTPTSALLVSSVFAILFNFATTGSYVFQSRDPRRLVGFFGVYGVVVLYNAIGLGFLADLSIGPRLAGLLLLPGAVAMAYGLNRNIVFRQRQLNRS